MMIWIAILANNVLGAYLALKEDALYAAYETFGRLWGFTAPVDERIGGLILWIPGSMMFLAAILLVIHMWVRQEERRGAAWGEALPAAPPTADEFRARQRTKNRALALGLLSFVLVVFVVAVSVVIVPMRALHP